ncbi:MAG: hypothetical protein WCK09_10610 [Bacteroidota bacterium]
MMKTVQRIGILFLLLVFLFGTTGLSVFHHFCHSSNHGSVTLYPEIFHSSGSSCCDDEITTGYACASHETFTTDPLSQHVDAAPCCKSTSTLFKLEILTEKVEKLVLNTFSEQPPLFSVSLNTMPLFELPLLKPAHYQFYSPPLFGKILVYYLHQMKIPAHPSFS